MIDARALNHLSPAAVTPSEAFALAGEYLHAQFFLEQLELLADAGLRRVQALSSGRDVQAVVDDRKQIFQLLQFHVGVRVALIVKVSRLVHGAN